MSENNVAQLPPPLPQPKIPHVFSDPVFVRASLELERHPQTERTCKVCGAVKVTVHHPDGRGWREWRVSASSAQIETDVTPRCEPLIGVAP